MNAVVQGTAADVMKLAMLAIGYDHRLSDLDCHMLLTVHDETISSAPKATAVQAASLIIEDMLGVITLNIPMKVDAEVYLDGRWYGDALKVKNKGDKTILLYEGQPISESDIPWAV
jgi:DNA polymerase I-like protein with 3'-5' exonuclease and polymerase domains